MALASCVVSGVEVISWEAFFLGGKILRHCLVEDGVLLHLARGPSDLGAHLIWAAIWFSFICWLVAYCAVISPDCKISTFVSSTKRSLKPFR